MTAGSDPPRLRVAVAGGEAAGQRVLRAIHAAGHEVVAVFAGIGPTGAPVRAEAERHGLPVAPAVRVKDPDITIEIGPIDLLINVHSLYVVAPEVLEWPRRGAFNLHPGWLPDYAGRNCPSWAVWQGELRPGLTVHQMSPEIDRGAVALQDRFPVDDTATGGSVAVECAKRGVELVGRVVDAVVHDSLELHSQDPSRFTYYGREVPNDGLVRFDQPAVVVDRFVRAADYGPFASPWGVPRAHAHGRPIGIRRTRRTALPCDDAPGTVRVEGDRALVACGDEWIEIVALVIDDVTAPPAAALASVAELR